MSARNVIILGAAGRDFHNHNVYYRENPAYNVVAFTATQIPGIANRQYPTEVAGKRYPKGIPILPEEQLPELIRKYKVDEVVLSYSDLPYSEVMHKASIALANGADFTLLGPNSTMLKSKKPVVAVTGTRTGVGKSPATRRVAEILHKLGKSVVMVRHPMPYFEWDPVQRFAVMEDLKLHHATIEEMEEYAPIIASGDVVYAGVDYEKILRAAEKEADIVIWDGGNNDIPFYRPDLWITIADAKRPGHELAYYPGEVNFRAADAIVISKVNTAKPEDIETVSKNATLVNPKAVQIRAELTVTVDEPAKVKGKRALIVDDGPTLTHGGMPTGAGTVAAEAIGSTIVNPRQYAVGMIKKAYEQYPHIGAALPALGYSEVQMAELEETINAVPADVVVIGTPVDLRNFLKINKPAVRVRYEMREVGHPDLSDVLTKWVKKGH
jgi:predicted GTPase